MYSQLLLACTFDNRLGDFFKMVPPLSTPGSRIKSG
jgi:hypothetical protein